MYLKKRHVTRPYFISIYNLEKLNINVLCSMSHHLQRLLLPQILIKVGQLPLFDLPYSTFSEFLNLKTGYCLILTFPFPAQQTSGNSTRHKCYSPCGDKGANGGSKASWRERDNKNREACPGRD